MSSTTPLSASAILDAHKRTHGAPRAAALPLRPAQQSSCRIRRRLPRHLDLARRVHRGPGAQGRSLDGAPPRCSYHVQIESRLSLTGHQGRPPPAHPRRGRGGRALAHLAARIAARAGAPFDAAARRRSRNRRRASRRPGAADSGTRRGKQPGRLRQPGRRRPGRWSTPSNHLLGSYGRTLDLDRPSLQRQGDDGGARSAARELRGGPRGGAARGRRQPGLRPAGGGGIRRRSPGRPAGGELRRGPRRNLRASPRTSAPTTTSSSPGATPSQWPASSACDQPAVRPLASHARLGSRRLAAWCGDRRPAYDLLREHLADGRLHAPERPAVVRRVLGHGRARRRGRPRCGPAGSCSCARRCRAVRAGHGDRAAAAARGAPGRLARTGALPDRRDARRPPRPESLAARAAGPDHESHVGQLRLPGAGNRRPPGADRRRRGAHRGGWRRPARVIELPVSCSRASTTDVVAVALGYGRQGTQRFASIGPQWLFGRPGVGTDGLVGVSAAPLISWRAGTRRYDTRRVRLAPTGRRRDAGRHPASPQHRRARSRVARPVPAAIVRETTLAALGGPGGG